MTVADGMFDVELHFTDVYKQFQNEHIAIREAMCLRAMFPANLRGICQGDLFAGRTDTYSFVGFSLEEASGGMTYYCWEDRLREKMQGHAFTPEYLRRIENMLAHWRGETTGARFNAALSDGLRQRTTTPVAGMFGRLSGVLPDMDRLVRLGIPGLAAEVEEGRLRARTSGGDAGLYEGMLLALELYKDVCRGYAGQCRALAEKADGGQWRRELGIMADVFDKITASRPETFREAAQLCWLYCLLAGVVNYGRMDAYLGDLYAHDIDAGVITEEEALELLTSLWQIIAGRNIAFNSRVVVGGRGRRNEENADRFALAAMEATRLVKETEPQLTLRFYDGMNPALMKKALDVIGEGRIYPMLYNDDVNIPAVAHAFGVSGADAEQYFPYGCGEYALDHMSFGSPNCSIMLLKALEVTLHGGRDGMTGEPVGLDLGAFESFKTFDELMAAYKRQVEYFVEAIARREAIENAVKARAAAYLFSSMLYEGCVERGKSLVGGGPKYLGAVVESFGMVNAADSLAAIKAAVYEKKLLTHQELLAALDADFAGYEQVRRTLLALPKFGNDDDYVDGILVEISGHVGRCCMAQAEKMGYDYFLVVNINNFGNVTEGGRTAASADGRRRGEPVANGNTPTAGRDTSGVTAFLNSIAKADPSVHAGYVHNMKFSPQMFTAERPKLEALLDGYFAAGGTQAMITVVSREDLENALKEPEKHKTLIVRVGGFSARFVELHPDIQRDILNRTQY